MKNILYYLTLLALLLALLINDAQNHSEDFISGFNSIENPYEILSKNK